jgi:UDP-2,4-diacetamido-2,4,6-trideoxy-beta-L-altropyranose hydrolase
LSLADSLKNDFDVTFSSIDKIDEKQVQSDITFLRVETEESFLNETINDFGIIVLDGYKFNSDYQKKIKEKNKKLVCIDDIPEFQFYADAVINHNPGINPETYSKEPYTKLCIGTDYCLLRKEFIEESNKETASVSNGDVYLCFGGSDFQNLTNRVLSELVKLKDINKINVVTGSAYSYKDELSKICKENKNISVFENAATSEIISFIKNSEFAICPSSAVAYESLLVGTKLITGYYADNQKEFYKYLVNERNVVGLNNFDAVSESLFTEVFKDLKLKNRIKIKNLNPSENFIKLFENLN